MSEGQRGPTILAWAIRTQREAMGMTQNELTKRSGVERSYISALERGDRSNISHDTLAAIARGLEISVADLFTLAGQIEGHNGRVRGESVSITVARDKAPTLKALERYSSAGLVAIEEMARRLLFTDGPDSEGPAPQPVPPTPRPPGPRRDRGQSPATQQDAAPA